MSRGIGIGQGRVTENLAPAISLIDDSVTIPDTLSLNMVFRLLDEEGIYVGASSALNVAAAYQVALKMPQSSTIVTILCDGAYRYQNRLFSKKWVKSKSLWETIPDKLKKYVILE